MHHLSCWRNLLKEQNIFFNSGKHLGLMVHEVPSSGKIFLRKKNKQTFFEVLILLLDAAVLQVFLNAWYIHILCVCMHTEYTSCTCDMYIFEIIHAGYRNTQVLWKEGVQGCKYRCYQPFFLVFLGECASNLTFVYISWWV